jgi:hypothetical protein
MAGGLKGWEMVVFFIHIPLYLTQHQELSNRNGGTATDLAADATVMESCCSVNAKMIDNGQE